MKLNDLPFPGHLANGIKLRVEAAKAIGSVQVTAMRTPGGVTPSAGKLASFFSGCAAALAGLYETTLPTVSSAVAASATQINVTFSEPMDRTVVPAVSAFASTGNTVTGVEWVSDTVLRLTGTGFAAAETLDYTAPSTNGLRDLSGNLVATATGIVLA